MSKNSINLGRRIPEEEKERLQDVAVSVEDLQQMQEGVCRQYGIKYGNSKIEISDVLSEKGVSGYDEQRQFLREIFPELRFWEICFMNQAIFNAKINEVLKVGNA